MLRKLLFSGWIFTIIFLFFYSFTQVDLGLTLTKVSIWQGAQRSFQQVGYFNRPLSAYLFIFIVFSLFALYFIFLKKLKASRLKTILKIIFITSLILLFSYNAFSYDLFNYIFDAKIVTHYNKNPYQYKALDFPGDPMLSFMHWTHRTFPYGPTWIAFTVPLSFLGFQYFLVTFFIFKALAAASFFASSFLISKISNLVKKEDQVYNLIFFAFNPLVIIESLVSAHNDIIMVFLSLLSIYFLSNKKYVRSILLLLLSIGIKYATAFLIPVYILVFYYHFKKKNVNWDKFFIFASILMVIPVILSSFRTNFQPWYLLNIIPFTVFISKKYFVYIPVIIFSFFSLLQYAPFLYLGNWDKPVPAILFWLTLIPGLMSIIFVSIRFARVKLK